MAPFIRCCVLILVLGLAHAARGQEIQNLADAFAAAWQRQPASRALAQRENAAQARLGAASNLLPIPPSVELSQRSDRYNRDKGSREQELGLILPLWLPGERSGSQALASAEVEALTARTQLLRLQLANELRQAWWAWQLARNERELGLVRVQNARQLKEDVARRAAAGDLSRADRHQAEGALAAADAALAEADANQQQALRRLQALVGKPLGEIPPHNEPDPQGENAMPPALARHPNLLTWSTRSEAARRAQSLAVARSRSNPEISLSTRRDRAGVGEQTDQTWALALRIPFAGGNRHDALVAEANAERIEAETQLELEQDKLDQDLAAARAQMESARQQLAANEHRARLALENRGFFDKSFRLGETDLPTRLRIEAEAFEAERQAARSRILLAQSISGWRQALGLLPE